MRFRWVVFSSLSIRNVQALRCPAGSLLRATAAEILGHPDPEVAMNARSKGEVPRDLKDLTSSRLQSELYCTFKIASRFTSIIT